MTSSRLVSPTLRAHTRSAAAETIRSRIAAPRVVSRRDFAIPALMTRSIQKLDLTVQNATDNIGPFSPQCETLMPLLHNGDAFPPLSIAKVGGGTLKLPDDLKGSFGVILVYRGAWCPFCNAQLAAFARMSDKLADAGVKVAAFSVDDEATTASSRRKAPNSLSRRLRRRRGRGRRCDRRLREPRAPIPPVNRLCARPRGEDCHRGLLVRRDRASRSRRRRGSGRLHQVEGALG